MQKDHDQWSHWMQKIFIQLLKTIHRFKESFPNCFRTSQNGGLYIKMAVVPKTFIKSLKSKLKICTSITFWSIDFKSTVMVHRGKITKESMIFQKVMDLAVYIT